VAPALEERTRIAVAGKLGAFGEVVVEGRLSVELSAFAIWSRPPDCTLPLSAASLVEERSRR